MVFDRRRAPRRGEHRHPRHGRRPARARGRAGRPVPPSSARAPPLLRAGRARPDLRGRGHRVCTRSGAGRADAAAGASGWRPGAHRATGADAAEALTAPLVVATTPAGAADALAAAVPDAPRAPSSTCSTTPGRPRWPRPGPTRRLRRRLRPRPPCAPGRAAGRAVHRRAPAPLAAMRAAGEAALAAAPDLDDGAGCRVRDAAAIRHAALGTVGRIRRGRAPGPWARDAWPDGAGPQRPGSGRRERDRGSTVEQVALVDRG